MSHHKFDDEFAVLELQTKTKLHKSKPTIKQPPNRTVHIPQAVQQPIDSLPLPTQNNDNIDQLIQSHRSSTVLASIIDEPISTSYDDEQFDDYDTDQFDIYPVESITIQPTPVVSPIKSILKNSTIQHNNIQSNTTVAPQANKSTTHPPPPTTKNQPINRQSNIISTSHQWPHKSIDPIQRTQQKYKLQRARNILQSVVLSVESFDIQCDKYTPYQLYYESLHSSVPQLIECKIQTHHNNSNNNHVYHNCTTEQCTVDHSTQTQWIETNDSNIQCTAQLIDNNVLHNKPVDQIRLNQFMQYAGTLCYTMLLESDQHNHTMDDITESINTTPISSTVQHIQLVKPYIDQRTIQCIQFSTNYNNLLYVVYNPVTNTVEPNTSNDLTLEQMLLQSMGNNTIDQCSIIICYDVTLNNTIIRSYISSSMITSINVAPSAKSHTYTEYIVCGCNDGSIVSYQSNNHNSSGDILLYNTIKFIQPIATTLMKYSDNQKHIVAQSAATDDDGLPHDKLPPPHSRIIKLHCVIQQPSTYNNINRFNNIIPSDHMFTVVSLDDMGIINIWQHQSILDSNRTSYTIKHIRRLNSISYSVSYDLCIINSVQCLTSITNKLQRRSLIEHMSLTPSIYSYNHDINHTADYAASISICPHDTNLFCVGYMSGIVSIYTIDCTSPLNTWYPDECESYMSCKLESNHVLSSIRCILWSTCRPSVIYVMDGNGILRILNILTSLSESIDCVQFNQINNSSCMSLNITNATIHNKQPCYLAVHGATQNSCESIEIHKLINEYTAPVPDELNQLKRVLRIS